MGLGHLTRTLLLCRQIEKRFENISTLLVTGSAMAHAFRMPPGVDYIKLPSVHKLGNEAYESRSLPIPFEDLLAMRAELIQRTVAAYKPDFLFVDNVPLGMKAELRPTLEYVREALPDTKVILNLRDIIDSASHVLPLWRDNGIFDVLDRFYDRIFIYGQQSVFDPPTEYEFSRTLRGKSRFCGYLPRPVQGDPKDEVRRALGIRDGERFVLVTVGGGSDGSVIVENYLRCLPRLLERGRVSSVILLGPEMPSESARKFCSTETASPVRFVDFCDHAGAYMAAADVVVSMAGYNTISEVLSMGKRAVVIPRVEPREEQLIRSRRLQEIGLLRMVHPAQLTPERLAAEILAALDDEEPTPEGGLDFGGVDRLGDELQLLMREQSESDESVGMGPGVTAKEVLR